MDSILDTLVEAEEARLSGAAPPDARDFSASDAPDVDFWSIKAIDTQEALMRHTKEREDGWDEESEESHGDSAGQAPPGAGGTSVADSASDSGSGSGGAPPRVIRIGLGSVDLDAVGGGRTGSRGGKSKRRGPAARRASDAVSVASHVSKSSVASRVRSVMSKRMGGTTAGAGAGGTSGSEAFELQQRAKEYNLKREEEQVQVAALDKEIQECKLSITSYKKDLGGVLALKTNDRNIQVQIDILERRIVKAQTEYMNQVAHNRRMATEVNVHRREKNAQLAENAATKKEFRALYDNSNQREIDIKTKHRQIEKVQKETEKVRAKFEEEQERLEKIWASSDAGDVDMSMPEPERGGSPDGLGADGRPAGFGDLTNEQEAELRGHTAMNRWESGAAHSLGEAAILRAEHMLDVFSVVAEATGVQTPEQFVEIFQAAESTNYALYKRTDQLIQESKDLQLAIEKAVGTRVQRSVENERDNESRTAVMDIVLRKTKATQEKAAKQREQYTSLVADSGAIRQGLARLMDLLGLADPSLGTASDNSLVSQFGKVERRLRDVMVTYVTKSLNADEREATISAHRLNQSMQQSRAGKTGLLSTVDDEDFPGPAPKVSAPLTAASALSIGPSTPLRTRRGGAASAYDNVHVPSTDGPKDGRQAAAFTRPFASGAGLDGTGSARSGEFPETDEQLDDTKPLAVPSPQVRNKHAMSHKSHSGVPHLARSASAGAPGAPATPSQRMGDTPTEARATTPTPGSPAASEGKGAESATAVLATPAAGRETPKSTSGDAAGSAPRVRGGQHGARVAAAAGGGASHRSSGSKASGKGKLVRNLRARGGSSDRRRERAAPAIPHSGAKRIGKASGAKAKGKGPRGGEKSTMGASASAPTLPPVIR